MKFSSRASEPYQLRWATKQQLDLRWKEHVLPVYDSAKAFFDSTSRSISTSKSVELVDDMLAEAVNNSLEVSLQIAVSHLFMYQSAVITFILNAFRHAVFYTDPECFFSYIEKSKSAFLKDLNTFSKSKIVSELKRNFDGVDKIFSDHVCHVEDRVAAFKATYEANKERKASSSSLSM